MEKVTGPNGAECYRITHVSGAEVTIARHGGHIISWKTANGKEQLYLSPLAEFTSGKAIRGGIPVIFPQFNENGPLGRHGFARKAGWAPDFETESMKFASTDETRAEWPHNFELSLRVQLTATTLQIEMTVKNTGESSFAFQAALHSYFRTEDVTACAVYGLETLSFENEVTGHTEISSHDGIQFGAEIDRSYLKAGDQKVRIAQQSEADALDISSENFPDFVVWNPGPDHQIGDLPPNGWREFVCIESAQVQNGSSLEPGGFWTGTQRVDFKEPAKCDDLTQSN